MRGPKTYRTLEEFEREEIRPSQKIGFSLDDLYEEATFNPEQEFGAEEPRELEFE